MTTLNPALLLRTHALDSAWINIKQIGQKAAKIIQLLCSLFAGSLFIMHRPVHDSPEIMRPALHVRRNKAIFMQSVDLVCKVSLIITQAIPARCLQHPPTSNDQITWLPHQSLHLIENIIDRLWQQFRFRALHRAFRVLLNHLIQLVQAHPGACVCHRETPLAGLTTLENHLRRPQPVQEPQMVINTMVKGSRIPQLCLWPQYKNAGMPTSLTDRECLKAVRVFFPRSVPRAAFAVPLDCDMKNRVIRCRLTIRTYPFIDLMEQ